MGKSKERAEVDLEGQNRPLQMGRVRFGIIYGGKGWMSFCPMMRLEWQPLPTQTIKTIMELKGEECVRKVADAGFNLVWALFSWGGGPTEERGAREEAKNFVKLCHQYGVKVLPYLQLGNVHWQTFFREFPEAPGWISKDPQGKPVNYNNTNYWFRYHMCLNTPNWVKYLESVIREILLDADADGICIDNIPNPPNTCYCDICKARFMEYIRSKYPLPELVKEFSLESFDEIEPPTKFVGDLATRPMQTLLDTNDKITRQWINFKADCLTKVLMRLADYARSLKPGAIVTGNTWTIALENKVANYPMDMPAIGKIFDMLYLEGMTYPRVEFLLGEPYMLSSIRDYKFGLACAKGKPVMIEPLLPRRVGTPQLYETPSPSQAKLVIAEGLACGGYGVVAISHEDTVITTEGTSDVLEAIKSYNRWMMRHEDCFVDVKSGANVAVLRSLSTLTWDWENATGHLTDFEQVLIQTQIPYDVILEGDLEEELRNYDVLILPNVTCLSDKNFKIIKSFVREGKGLVATCDSLRYDESFKLREKDVWREMLGDFHQEEAKVKATYGEGRVVFYPKMPGASRLVSFGFLTGNTYLPRFPRLLDNWEDIVDSVRWAAGKLLVKVGGPKTLFIHLWRQEDPKRYLLHLVNYRQRPVKNIDVKVRTLLEPAELSLLSPDLDEPLLLEGNWDGEYLTFRIPELKVYDLVCVGLRAQK